MIDAGRMQQSIYIHISSVSVRPVEAAQFPDFGGSRGGIQQHYPGVGAETWLNLHVRNTRSLETSAVVTNCGNVLWSKGPHCPVAVGGDVSCQFLWPFISKFHGGWIDGCAGLVVAVGPSFSRMQAQWARVGRSRVDGFSWRKQPVMQMLSWFRRSASSGRHTHDNR